MRPFLMNNIRMNNLLLALNVPCFVYVSKVDDETISGDVTVTHSTSNSSKFQLPNGAKNPMKIGARRMLFQRKGPSTYYVRKT